jgi:hypothetical protein
VTADDIDTMLLDLSRSLSPNTIKQIRNYLYRMFEDATERRYILYNPVRKPRTRKKPAQRAPVRLSAPQTAQFLTVAADNFYLAALWLIVILGLPLVRRAASVALTWI